MGLKKIKLLLLPILFQCLLLSLEAVSTATTTDYVQELNATGGEISIDKEMTAKLTGSKRVVSVNRKGGGVGGRAGGHRFGGRFGGGGRAIGGRGAGEARGSSSKGGRGSSLIPIYAAGAMPHHQNNHHRNGSNQGNLNTVYPPRLLLVLLLVVFPFNVLHS